MANHPGFPRCEGKHFPIGHAPLPIAGIDALLNVAEQILDGGIAGLNLGVGHADDRRVVIVQTAGVACGSLT